MSDAYHDFIRAKSQMDAGWIMSIDAPKMPWKACDSNRFRVTFGVVCDRKQIGPETRWKRESSPNRTDIRSVTNGY